jgi:hypothetical protein
MGELTGAEDDARAAVDIWRGGLETYLPAAVCWLVLALLERDMPEEASRALLAAGPIERWQCPPSSASSSPPRDTWPSAMESPGGPSPTTSSAAGS